jgi:hypothetical protein
VSAFSLPSPITPIQPPSLQFRDVGGKCESVQTPTPRRRLSDWGTKDCSCLTCRAWRIETADRRSPETPAGIPGRESVTQPVGDFASVGSQP